MNRRGFLAASAAVVAAASWPSWLQDALAAPAHDGLATLSTAWRRAQQSGKALLVLVIPDEASKWDRGRVFGELLNHADAGTMAALATVEVVCARMADVRVLIPQAPPGEPLMLLAETDRLPADVVAIDPALATSSPTRGGSPDGDDAVDRRIAVLSAAVRAPLLRLLPRHAAQVAAAVGPAVAAERVAAFTSLPPDAADAVAALLWHAYGDEAVPLLAEAAIARLRTGRVPGGRWAQSYGCGVHYEDAEPGEGYAIGCGMGFVPEKSTRFLAFWNETL